MDKGLWEGGVTACLFLLNAFMTKDDIQDNVHIYVFMSYDCSLSTSLCPADGVERRLKKTCVKEFCRPGRPPQRANPALFTAPAGRDRIHPLTQLALQPVEWRNSATSSLCDIPRNIMHGPGSASHGGPHTKLISYGFTQGEMKVGKKREEDLNRENAS